PLRCRSRRARVSLAARERVERGRGERAAAAAAVQRDEVETLPEAGERRLGFGRADKTDRKAEDESRFCSADRDHLEQSKERGGPHRGWQPGGGQMGAAKTRGRGGGGSPPDRPPGQSSGDRAACR